MAEATKPMSEWGQADWDEYHLSSYDAELTKAAALLQKYVTIGQVKAIGLLEVSAAIEMLTEENEIKPVEAAKAGVR